MEKNVLIKLIGELLAAKGALELDFISKDKMKSCLDEFYQQIARGNYNTGLLTILIQKQYLSNSQAEFLCEEIEEEQKRIPPDLNIKDRQAIEKLLGISTASSTASSTSPNEQSYTVSCPHCSTKYRVKLQKSSNKLKCAKCSQYFYASLIAGSNKVSVAKTPGLGTSPGEALPTTTTINLNATQLEQLHQQISSQPQQISPQPPHLKKSEVATNSQHSLASKQRQSEETVDSSQALWSMSSEESSNATAVDTTKEESRDKSQALWSSEKDEIKQSETNSQSTSYENAQALWTSSDPNSSESTPVIPTSTASQGGVDYDLPSSQDLGIKTSQSGVDYDLPSSQDLGISPPAANPQVSPQEELPKFDFPSTDNPSPSDTLHTDFLKDSQEEVVDSFDLLNISSKPAPNMEIGGTMELDIRTTPLFKKENEQKKKPGPKTTQECLKNVQDMLHLESLVVLKYAINYDYLSMEEAKRLVAQYYAKLSRGEKTENFAALLLTGGFITKFQYSTLLEILEKDRVAKRIPLTLDVASQEQVENFLGSTNETKLMRIVCPHCKTSFRVRVSLKGGKFRCGKCHESFFLSQKN